MIFEMVRCWHFIRTPVCLRPYFVLVFVSEGLFLFSGPEFVPINAICRDAPETILDVLKGDVTISQRNTLVTLLFCIASAIKKLGKRTALPSSAKVYRGLGKMLLPKQFWEPHGKPSWRGGVERAFNVTICPSTYFINN